MRSDSHIIELRGHVGTDVTAAGVIAELARAGERRVLVRIDTGGGHFESAFAIVAALRAHPSAVRIVIIRALSAGFVIAHAVPVEHRIIAGDGVMLYHRVRHVVAGTVLELDAERRQLAEIDNAIRTIVGRSADELRPLEEQRLDAHTCLRLGLVGQIGALSGRMRDPEETRSPALIAADEIERLVATLLSSTNSSRERARGEAQLATQADPALAARIADISQPATIPPVDHENTEEVHRIADGMIESRRREIEVLEGVHFNARRVAAALRAGVTPPRLVPPHWHCARCGQSNFHAPAVGYEPLPCAHCNATIPGDSQ